MEGLHRRQNVPNPHLPLSLATLSPRMIALTEELADGWLGTAFVPEGAEEQLRPLREGAARSGRTLADLDLGQGAEVTFAADEIDLAVMAAARKPGVAFSLGGTGTAGPNFCYDAYRRQGWVSAPIASAAWGSPVTARRRPMRSPTRWFSRRRCSVPRTPSARGSRSGGTALAHDAGRTRRRATSEGRDPARPPARRACRRRGSCRWLRPRRFSAIRTAPTRTSG